MRWRKLLLATFFITVLITMTGCEPMAGASVRTPDSLTVPIREPRTAQLPSPTHDLMVPAPVQFNRLQQSNTYYNVKMYDEHHGYRWGFVHGEFHMQFTVDRVHWDDVALPSTWSYRVLREGAGQVENPHVDVTDGGGLSIVAIVLRQLLVSTTSDNGDTWSSQRIPLPQLGFRLESVSQPKTTDMWVLVRGARTDGATHILAHVKPNREGTAQVHIVVGAKDAGLPASAQAVVAFADGRVGYSVDTTSDGKLHAYVTNDGGRSWRFKTVVAPPAVNNWHAVRVYQPTLVGREGLFVARYVGYRNGLARVKTVVYRSQDNGYHFEGQVVPFLDGATANYLGCPVVFVTAHLGICVSGDELVRVTDSGKGWQVESVLPMRTWLRLYPRVLALDYPTADWGYIILQTRDYQENVFVVLDKQQPLADVQVEDKSPPEIRKRQGKDIFLPGSRIADLVLGRV